MNLRLLIGALLIALTSFGQENILIPNVNPTAKHLIHHLNQTRDSAYFEYNDRINKITITQNAGQDEHFRKAFYPKGNKMMVPLDEVPLGRSLVSISVKGKMILITLLKYEIPRQTQTPIEINYKPKVIPLVEKQIKVVDEVKVSEPHIKALPKKAPETTSAFAKLQPPDREPVKDIVQYYWVVIEVNSGFGSYITEGAFERKVVMRMIEKNKHDLKSLTGRYNRLTVWKIHNLRAFTDSAVKIDGITHHAKDTFDAKPIYP